MSKRDRSEEVPVVEFRGSVPEEQFVEAFCQGVCILRPIEPVTHGVSLEWLHGLFSRLAKDRESFTVENKTCGTAAGADFLAPAVPARGYCSFVVQKDAEALKELTERLPFPELPVRGLRFVDAVWVFVARNGSEGEALAGRPPHTDSLQEDGTYHFQSLGTKTWSISSQHGSHEVEVQQGDLFVIDTTTWLHSTQIAPQAGGVSVSLARDFCLPGRAAPPEQGADLTNVDGPYAVEPIEAGTILFRAEECPDIELGRSTDPNCELVDIDGLAIVSLRDIAPGEFFCIAHSSDDGE